MCILCVTLLDIEGVSQNLGMLNGRFETTSGHFFANYINIFHKTEVKTSAWWKNIYVIGEKMTNSGLKTAIKHTQILGKTL